MNFTHFDVELLAPGVYAAITSEDGGAGCNAGIIDLGHETVVFDTMCTLSAAEELLAAARALTGRAPKYAINSHSHPDHIHGNAVFSPYSILLSSSITRSEIQVRGMTQMQNMKADISTQVEQIQHQLQADDLGEREGLTLQANLRILLNILDGYPTCNDLRLPTMTFERSLDFHGTSRSVHLLTFGAAHSKCDAVLWVPQEKILFAGDLVIPDGTLILSLGAPERWPAVLDHLEDLGAETLVPGHGRVVRAAEGYRAARAHLAYMFDLAKEAIESGHGLDYADRVEVPKGHGEYWFRKDLKFLIERELGTSNCRS